MKNTLKLVLAIVIVALCSSVSAQNVKLAHIEFTELILAMPEYDSAMVKMQKFTKELESELETMQVELNRKYDEFTKNQENMSDLVKQSRWEEVQRMNERIQRFQEQAQEQYQQEQAKLLQPIQEKANKAIDAVAKEQGITYVLNSQAIHFKAAGTLDLLPSVKKYLGIP